MKIDFLLLNVFLFSSLGELSQMMLRLQYAAGSLPGRPLRQRSCSTLYEQNIGFEKLPEPRVLLQAGKALA